MARVRPAKEASKPNNNNTDTGVSPVLESPFPEDIRPFCETEPRLVDIALKERAVLLAFVSPYGSVRISPVEEQVASIGLVEEVLIEQFLEEVDSKAPEVDTLYLLINSPGGGISSAYKIARSIRLAFKKIKVFVPHIASSAASLVALVGDSIVMGRMSQLGPMDVQVSYAGAVVSTRGPINFFHRSCEWFKTKRAEEVEYPKRALVDKLDPIVMEEWTLVLGCMKAYLLEILLAVGYSKDNAIKLCGTLVDNPPHHSYAISREMALALGVEGVIGPSEGDVVWREMRRWFWRYALEDSLYHHVAYVIPSLQKGG